MKSLYDRLLSRTEITAAGCWIWTGQVDRDGYGEIKVDGKTKRVHRIAYMLLGAPFDHSLELDHTCRVKRCWRPEHLEPKTSVENNRQSNPTTMRNMAVTHCPKGHEYDESNTFLRKRPGGQVERECRACRRDNWRAWYHRRKAA